MRRLVSGYFNEGPLDCWPRLARVLTHTARRHCPEWALDIRRLWPGPLESALGNRSHVENTHKMQHWSTALAAAADGDELLLIDTDTVILRPLEDVWSRPFDFAYTTKASLFPFNTGVVFVRVSPRLRTFVEAWRLEQLRMLGDSKHHQAWRRRFGGINQAALGYVLEQGRGAGIEVLELPCLEWNCEDHSWPSFDPALTRIVHIKSALRAALFRTNLEPEPVVVPLAARWRALEAEALAACVVVV